MDPTPYAHNWHKTLAAGDAGGGAAAVAGAGGGVPSPHSYALSGKIMLSAIVILFSIVLLILFLHFYVRWHVLRRAARRARRRRRRFLFAGENQSPSTNRAIDPSILKSLPVLLYSSVDESDECDCAVCLNEFEDGQKIRNLPLCGHSFHIDCIDMWFSSHSNCPLCRSAVEAAPSCRREEEIGSSSSDSGEVGIAIEMPERGIEGFSGEAERLGLGQALKWPINRVVLLRRFLTLEIQSNRNSGSGASPDLEGGGTAAPAPAE